jgi:hypothetical protein
MSDNEYMIIPIAKPQTKIDKNRPINLLLQAQVRHLLEIEHRQLPPFQRTGETEDLSPMSKDQMDEYLKSWTEGRAADYIGKMTAKLHEINTKPKRTRRRKTTPKGKTGSSK